MRRGILAAAVIFSMLAAAPAWADDCKYERPIDLNIGAAGAQSARISVGAGSLRIEGGAGDAVVITGRACASSADRLEGMVLHAGLEGDRVEIETEVPDDWSWSGGKYAYFDLEIHVPGTLPLEVADGSGDAEIRDVASLEMSDGSGSLDIRGVAGDVRVDDGSGDVEIVGAGGDVEIRDGSGNLEIRDVGGTLRVRSDGSGNIVADGVRGDFRVDSDGSGSIRYDDVSGRVDIPERKRRQ